MKSTLEPSFAVMAGTTGVKLLVTSDDRELTTAPEDSKKLAALGDDTAQIPLQLLSASAAEPVQAGGLDDGGAQQDDEPEQAPEIDPGPRSKPPRKSKPKSRMQNMLKELEDFNELVLDSNSGKDTSEKPVEVAEEFLEGLHGTRAARKGVDNAVKNRAAAQRESLNAKELMKKTLRVLPVSPKKQKRVKRLFREDSVTAAERLWRGGSEASRAAPETRKKRGKSKAVESDEDMEGTPGPKPADVEVARGRTKQKQKKTPSPKSSDDSPYGEEYYDVDDADVPKAPSAYLKRPDIQPTRQSSRLRGVAPAETTPAPEKPSPPKLKTSGMTWSKKKGKHLVETALC